MPNLRACVLLLVPLAALTFVGCGGSSSNDDGTNGGDGGKSTTTDRDATVPTGGGGGSDSGGGGGSLTDGSTGPGGDSGGGGGGDDDGGRTGTDAGAACTKGSDCPLSGICNPSGDCAAPTCMDGVQNQNETDIDCGGMCAACDALKKCSVPGDCTSGVCTGNICQAPTDMDGVQNGNETGIDCGGMGNPKCAAGQGCNDPVDCTTDVCTANVCVVNSCTDHVQNGQETDVDCGGFDCPRCVDNDKCVLGSDCIDGICKTSGANGLRCTPPSYTDGVKNGNETDTDCGGTGDPTVHGCAAPESCIVDTDCISDGCDYNKHCAIHRSCAGTKSGQRYGADTCGAGGAGSIGVEAWESCCSTIDVSVTQGTPATKSTVHLDKYKVTAGRMRQFLESVNGNVKGFVQTARTAGQIPVMPVIANNPAKTTVLPPAWDKYLPTSMAGDTNETKDCDQSGWSETNHTCNAGTAYAPIYSAANNHIGPAIFKANSQTEQGCDYGSPGTHTYYLGSPDPYGEKPDFDQTVYDTKPLQCVDYLMAQAFCVWDGGRLETTEEWLAAYGAGALPTSSSTTLDTRGKPFSGLTPKSDLPSSNSEPCTTGATGNAAQVCAGGASACKNGVCVPNATYTACRFPTATNLLLTTTNPGGCQVWTVPSATQTIEMTDYQYNYEYPTLKNTDFAVFIAAPGRTLGRAPLGHADIIGDLFEITSDFTGYADNPFPAPGATTVPVVAWSGNGSWEVHGYKKGANGSYRVLDKYGKMGLRCVHN